MLVSHFPIKIGFFFKNIPFRMSIELRFISIMCMCVFMFAHIFKIPITTTQSNEIVVFCLMFSQHPPSFTP